MYQNTEFQSFGNTKLSETKRWVLVAPPGSNGCSILLAQAANPEQISRIGNQTGGRVFLFLHTKEIIFGATINTSKVNRTTFWPPSTEPYGTVAVFQTIYGNLGI